MVFVRGDDGDAMRLRPLMVSPTFGLFVRTCRPRLQEYCQFLPKDNLMWAKSVLTQFCRRFARRLRHCQSLRARGTPATYYRIRQREAARAGALRWTRRDTGAGRLLVQCARPRCAWDGRRGTCPKHGRWHRCWGRRRAIGAVGRVRRVSVDPSEHEAWRARLGRRAKAVAHQITPIRGVAVHCVIEALLVSARHAVVRPGKRAEQRAASWTRPGHRRPTRRPPRWTPRATPVRVAALVLVRATEGVAQERLAAAGRPRWNVLGARRERARPAFWRRRS